MNTTFFRKGVAATDLGVLLPDLSMLSTQDLGIEITVVLNWDGVDIGLSTDLDTLVIGEVDVFCKGVGVEGREPGKRLAQVLFWRQS